MRRAHPCTTRRPADMRPSCLPAGAVVAGLQFVSDSLHLPFDVMRNQHAHAVHAGFLANSILESRDFERTVDALEHMTLGPFARDV